VVRKERMAKEKVSRQSEKNRERDRAKVIKTEQTERERELT
jgi:hypothetical protein